MSNVPGKSCRENQNTFYILYLISKTRAIYEIMWRNMVEPERPHKHRHTLWICNTYLLFHDNNAYSNKPQCFVIHKLPILFPAGFGLSTSTANSGCRQNVNFLSFNYN